MKERQLTFPFLLGSALVRLGDAWRSLGRSDEAGRALREAIRIGERLGASPLVEEARAAGSRAHLRLDADLPPAASDAGLTGRELEVLRLVADGLSNSGIVRTLVISPKTVSVHVSRILAKLGVSSRGEAAAVAHKAGLVAVARETSR